MAGEREAIAKQLDFYFSNSNLWKDRFLGNLVHKEPERCRPFATLSPPVIYFVRADVDISVIADFNKMKELGATVAILRELVTESPTLEVESLDACVCLCKLHDDAYSLTPLGRDYDELWPFRSWTRTRSTAVLSTLYDYPICSALGS